SMILNRPLATLLTVQRGRLKIGLQDGILPYNRRMTRILAVTVVFLTSLFAQDGRPFSQVMKEIAGASGQVKKAFEDGAKEEVASGGTKLESLFKEVEEFFTKRSAADAIESAHGAQVAAKE